MDGSELKVVSSEYWDHVTHIVRDTLVSHGAVVYYGDDQEAVNALRSPQHGFEAWRLCTDDEEPEDEYAFNWLLQHNDSHFGFNHCDLFMSIGYDPFKPSDPVKCAYQVARILKPGGLVLAVATGEWASKLGVVLTGRDDLVAKIKCYSMFANRDVQVYQR